MGIILFPGGEVMPRVDRTYNLSPGYSIVYQSSGKGNVSKVRSLPGKLKNKLDDNEQKQLCENIENGLLKDFGTYCETQLNGKKIFISKFDGQLISREEARKQQKESIKEILSENLLDAFLEMKDENTGLYDFDSMGLNANSLHSLMKQKPKHYYNHGIAPETGFKHHFEIIKTNFRNLIKSEFENILNDYNSSRIFDTKKVLLSSEQNKLSFALLNKETIHDNFKNNFLEEILPYVDKSSKYITDTFKEVLAELQDEKDIRIFSDFESHLKEIRNDGFLSEFQNEDLIIEKKYFADVSQLSNATSYAKRAIALQNNQYVKRITLKDSSQTFLQVSPTGNYEHDLKYLDKQNLQLIAILGTGFINAQSLSSVTDKDSARMGYLSINDGSSDSLKLSQLKPWMQGGFITYKDGSSKSLDLRSIDFKDRENYLDELSGQENVSSVFVIGKILDEDSLENPKKYHLENVLDGEEACLVFDKDTKQLKGSFYTSGGVTPIDLYKFATQELYPNGDEIELVRMDTDWFAKFYVPDQKNGAFSNSSAMSNINNILLVKERKDACEVNKKPSPLEKIYLKTLGPTLHLMDDVNQGFSYLLKKDPDFRFDVSSVGEYLKAKKLPATVTPKKFLKKFLVTSHANFLPKLVKDKLKEIANSD